MTQSDNNSSNKYAYIRKIWTKAKKYDIIHIAYAFSYG